MAKAKRKSAKTVEAPPASVPQASYELPVKPEPTITMRFIRDGSLHPCLFHSINFAMENGYAIHDPEEYARVKRDLRKEADDGEMVRPDGVGDEADEVYVEGSDELTWAQRQRAAMRRR